jgi:lysophospholipase L1-like esterase
MRKRRLAWLPLLVLVRALRVRISVGPRRRYWHRRAQRGELNLVALGDSLTQGIGLSRPSMSWLGRFASHVASAGGRSVRIDNRAVYGARIADLIAAQLPVPVDADIVTVCIGANDSGRTEPDAFRADLRQVCGQLPPGSIVGDVPEFQWGARIAAAAQLSQIVRDVVAEFPALFLARVEFHTTGTRILTELAGDFFHPSDSGYRRIAAAFVSAWDAGRVVAPVGTGIGLDD